MKRLLAPLAALMLLATMVPTVGAVSAEFNRQATSAPAVDSSICSGKVAVYIYDLWGFNFDANHPVKRFCGSGTPSQILIPNLGSYSCPPINCNNMASSARARNVTTQVVKFWAGVNYDYHIVTCNGNCDIVRFSDYGGANSDNNLSSFYAV